MSFFGSPVYRAVQKCASTHIHSLLNHLSPLIAPFIAKQRVANVKDDLILLYSRAKAALIPFGGIWQENRDKSFTLRSPGGWSAYAYQYGLLNYACNCVVDAQIAHEAVIPRVEKSIQTGLYRLRCHKCPTQRVDGSLDYSQTCGLDVIVYFWSATAPRHVKTRSLLPEGAITLPYQPRARAQSSSCSARSSSPDLDDFGLADLFDDQPVAGPSTLKRKPSPPTAAGPLHLHVPTPALKRRKSTGDGTSNTAPIIAAVPARSARADETAERLRQLIAELFNPEEGLDIDSLTELDDILSAREACTVCGMTTARDVFKAHIHFHLP